MPCHLQQLFRSSTIYYRKRNYIAPFPQRDFYRHQLLRVHSVELVRELSRRKHITLALKRTSNISAPPVNHMSPLHLKNGICRAGTMHHAALKPLALTPPLNKSSGRDTSPWVSNSPYRGPGNRVGFSDFILTNTEPEGSMPQEYRLTDKSRTNSVTVYNHQRPRALI